jgi:transcription initiation factor TFIID subunit 10
MSDPLPNNATSDDPQPTSQEDTEMTVVDEGSPNGQLKASINEAASNGQLEASTNGIQAPIVDEEMAEREPARLELQEARIPTKKDATLREFLSKMDDYAPIVSYLLTACCSRSIHPWLTREIPRFQMQSQTTTSPWPVSLLHQ